VPLPAAHARSGKVRVGHFKSQRAQARFITIYGTAMAQLSAVSESTDVPTPFGTVRAYRFDGPAAGPPVVLLARFWDEVDAAGAGNA
jgi:hypothetical protein